MKKKVLIIEDDTIVRNNTAEILQLANYDVITAENGKLGIEKATFFNPDLIICDILMPVLDGYGVLQIISRNRKLQKTPFIFMTAKTSHDDVRKGMDLGASDYITKPFEGSELLSAVTSRLKRKEIFDNKEEDDYTVIKKVKIQDIENEFINKERFVYEKGMSIYCEGNNSNHIFYIIKGEVKTFKISEGGKELITNIFKDKSFFGFTSFINNKPYNENAVTISKTKVLKISKFEVLKLVKQNPQFAINFMDLLTNDLANVQDHLIHLAYDSVRKKTANTLIELHNENENGFIVEISRSNLANLIGIAKETLIRTLTDFKEENIIKSNRNSIKIVNLKKLSSIK
jgi:CheY-like chemotaxis protein/CRP-like cAMP-binding protein